jgi:hypothetical protein
VAPLSTLEHSKTTLSTLASTLKAHKAEVWPIAHGFQTSFGL